VVDVQGNQLPVTLSGVINPVPGGQWSCLAPYERNRSDIE